MSKPNQTSKDQPVDELHSQRKVLADFLKGGTLTDGSVNPNTLNTLHRYIQAECNRARIDEQSGTKLFQTQKAGQYGVYIGYSPPGSYIRTQEERIAELQQIIKGATNAEQ